MNKEEIEELKEFTIDFTDIDELSLGLEICSKKSNMVIQEFADTIIQLQQENKQLQQEILELKAEYGNKAQVERDLLLEENKQLKENWNELKDLLEINWRETQDIWFVKIINKMKDIDKGDSK